MVCGLRGIDWDCGLVTLHRGAATEYIYSICYNIYCSNVGCLSVYLVFYLGFYECLIV